MIPWIKFTSYGDTMVMIPAAFIILVWLTVGRAWRMAIWWCLLLIAGLVLVAATKIAFVGWGVGIRSIDFTGISGHAMRATAVLPVIFYLMLSRSPRSVQLCGIALGISVGVLLSISRVEVSAHSVSEAAAGCLLGLMISAGFIKKAFPSQQLTPKTWLIVFSLIALFPTIYAKPAPTHRWINEVALFLSGRDKPYEREHWKNHPLESRINRVSGSALHRHSNV